jgi:hypothetical protein
MTLKNPSGFGTREKYNYLIPYYDCIMRLLGIPILWTFRVKRDRLDPRYPANNEFHKP